MTKVCATLALVTALVSGPAIAAPNEDLRRTAQRDLGMSEQQVLDYEKLEKKATHLGHGMRQRLGADFAGSWLEKSSSGDFEWVVGVKAKKGEAEGRRSPHASGAKIVTVRFSEAELNDAAAKFDTLSTTPGFADLIFSWGLSSQDNAIVVIGNSNKRPQVLKLIRDYFSDQRVVRVEFEAQRPSQSMLGGEQLRRDGVNWCSSGFNGTRLGQRGFLTAGHCFPADEPNRLIGSAAHGNQGATLQFSSYTTVNVTDAQRQDGAWIAINNGNAQWTNPPMVNNYGNSAISTAVTGQIEVPQGGIVCKLGVVTQAQCGQIRSLWYNTTYEGGAVLRDLKAASYCSAQGDSGGAVISQTGEAQGVHSGAAAAVANGEFGGVRHNCHVATSSRLSFYQSLQALFNRWQIQLNTVDSCGRLNPGYFRLPWQRITSCNGQYFMELQGDGNLVVRRADGQLLWQSGLTGGSFPRLTMQIDGNLVVTAGMPAVPIWRSEHAVGGNTLFISDSGDVYLLGFWRNVNKILYCDSTNPASFCYLPPWDNPGGA
jgi:streptogrisin C